MSVGNGRIPLVEYAGRNTEYIGRVWVRQRVAGEIVRGYQRKGVKAGNLRSEAVYTNDKTSPRLEVPRVVINTLRIKSGNVTAHDIALFWRLFAQARLNGMQHAMHSVRLSELRHYLGYRSSARIYQSLQRLSDAEISFDVGRGRVSASMIRLADAGFDDVRGMDAESGLRKGDTLVHFRLPEALCEAVLQSREYAWIDLNALPRFRCKHTTSIYMRFCLVAGRSRWHWRSFSISKAALKRALAMPSTIRDSVLRNTLRLVEADLSAIDGPRKRFEATFLWPHSNAEDDTFEFEATASKRRVREVAPVKVSDQDYKRVADYTFTRLERNEIPSVLRLRQATTLARETRGGIHVLAVRDLWARALNEAKLGNGVAGMPASEFLALLGEDIDRALELWISFTDFGADIVYQPVPVRASSGQALTNAPAHKRPRAAQSASTSAAPANDVEEDDGDDEADDLRTGDDFGTLHNPYDDPDDPPDLFSLGGDDIDDWEIDA